MRTAALKLAMTRRAVSHFCTLSMSTSGTVQSYLRAVFS